MNEEKKFDELLSSKLSEREFPLDELNWDKAERLIILQERRKKILRFSLVFSAGLAVGIAVMLPFIWNANTTLTDKMVTKSKNNQEPIASNSSALPVNRSPETTTKTVENGNQVSSNNESAITKNTEAIPIGAAPSKSFTVSNGRGTVLIKDKVGETKYENLPGPGLIAFTRKSNKASGHSESISPHEQSSTEEATNVNPLQAESNETVQSENPSNKINTLHKSDSANNSTLLTNKNSFGNTDVIKNSLANTIPASNNFNQAKPKKDSNKTAAKDSLPMLPGTQPNYPLYKADGVSLLAGWDYSFGWKVNGEQEGNAFSFPFLNINYVHNFSRNTEVSVGIGFTHYGILNEAYTSSITQYDFGQTAKVTTVNPTDIYYMDFPVAFNYNISRKWTVGGGLDFLWLLTDLSTITTYQQSLFGTTAQNSYKQDGYTQGFNNYNFLFTGGITYMFGKKKKLGLKLEGYLGINSVKNGAFPGTDHSGYWNGVRLLFLWNIFKKGS